MTHPDPAPADTPELAPQPPAASAYSSLDPAALRHPDSLKWTHYPEDVLPLWVADMDFPVAPAIVEALQERLGRGLGYGQLFGDERLIAALQDKLAGYGLGELPREGFSFTPGVVPGIYAAVAALSAPGEPVLTMTPIYYPFHQAVTNQGRRVAAAPLREPEGPGGRWNIDWNALEAAAPGCRLLLLCHPHNPSGRVWDKEELARLRDFVLRHDLHIMSDELHADLRLSDVPFEAFAADPRVQGRTVTLTGPAKAYNTAGLGIGVMVGHDPELVKRVRGAAGGLMGHPSTLSVAAWRAALAGAGPWLRDTVAYLRGNRDVMAAFVEARLPWARFSPPEATYLGWLDLRAHPRAAEMQEFLLKEAKVAVQGGPLFAPEGEAERYQGCVRVNFATGRPLLIEALERMTAALEREAPAAVGP
ncbi:aminotransferase class I [Deinococcus sp. RL]|uniref:MalY/PatB family protein n=1 Tax=Deinococcus sp. RL TaxID=1489678 RepID=UPI0004D4BCE2|nr:aminotransferase class I/II-fold pyridoxal phosphate-dependent enzyme [Deinococcus sp. RL]KEF33206.1 aminotransferase class I [Deinococcus sp. RL]